MSDDDTRYLEVFPSWLSSLAADANRLSKFVDDTAMPESARVTLAGALNYLFKSVDLIADGIEDLGYVDDAFVLRVAAGNVDRSAFANSEDQDQLQALAEDSSLIAEFLGLDFPRLQAHVSGLVDVPVRGRSAQQIAADADVRSEFLRELREWSEQYQAPSFAHEPKNLVKLRSFMSTKLQATNS
jgi:uncharacterized membrane protein YkvA (DUF1232 family)